jgi:hypothetical protein
LNPIDWAKLQAFGSAGDFFADRDLDPVEELTPEDCICHDNGWESDSATQYFQVAEALENLLVDVAPEVAVTLKNGIMRLVCESGHVDEFQTGAASEGHYWLSASPETARELLRLVEAVDWQQLVSLHSAKADADSELDAADFMECISQHLAILRIAAHRKLGLLGHCG